MQQVQKLPATLINRLQLNDTYYELTFQFDACITYQPGQYLSFEAAKNTFRPYSICSAQTKGTMFNVCIDTKPSGVGSKFAKEAPIGTKTQILFPLGKFLLSTENKSSIFIATGSGISPFRSMIKKTLETNLIDEITLLWGMPYQKDIYWQNFWQELLQKHPNFNYTFCISRETISAANYYSGRVTKILNTKYKILNTSTQAYLCGNGNMIQEAKDILTQKGMLESDIHYERYY